MAIVSFTNYKRKQTKGMMAAVMRYTMQEKKTAWEDKRLVSGVNCSTETVCGDFMTTKRLHYKEGGTLFYHMVQSFPAGEQVDPVTAHAAALELANYFSDCEVLVCTHIDRAGFDSSGAGHGVWNRNSGQQHPKPVSLTPLYGLAALGALMEDDSEDTEERYRRMIAEQEAKNFGAVISLAAGAAIALTKKPEEEVQQEQQQTMGGL